jgi:outer membrane protein TolC
VRKRGRLALLAARLTVLYGAGLVAVPRSEASPPSASVTRVVQENRDAKGPPLGIGTQPPQPVPAPTGASPGPAPPVSFPDVQVLPIDLLTALRLTNASNPTIALARERVREAYARQRQAEVVWLPNLETGPAYVRHDGQIQNSIGNVFTTSKSNFFIGGGAAMRFETADALFLPIIARRLTQAEAEASRAVTDNIQLDVALTYLDLLRVYGALAINADALARAELLLQRALGTKGLSRSTADTTRARTEVNLRREERADLEGQAAEVCARLAQLLLLQPTLDLRPVDLAVVPIALVPLDVAIDELVATALLNRPELAESRALVEAALVRWRQARLAPFIPRIEVDYLGGGFGGGRNETIGNFDGRGDGLAQAVWELRNLGAGNVAVARERRAQYNEANLHVIEVQARVAAEVAAAAKVARSRQQALTSAQEAVKQALETWRRLEAAAFGALDPNQQHLLNTLEPLIAEQTLAQARSSYLTQVTEYNKAQFRLHTAMGRPPIEALPQSAALPVEVPVAPPKFEPAAKPLKPPPAPKP